LDRVVTGLDFVRHVLAEYGASLDVEQFLVLD